MKTLTLALIIVHSLVLYAALTTHKTYEVRP